MREIVVTVPAAAAEDVLDKLLPLAPEGVREEQIGERVQLRFRGASLPSLKEVRRAARPWPHNVQEHEVPDDWAARRLLDYREAVVGGRVVIRPDWAPSAPRRGLLEIVLAGDVAFGSGGHPTTRAVMEAILEAPIGGSFADLGCGTGVLAILAAKLGFRPVSAVDLSAISVAAAMENARLNDAEVDVRVSDLLEQAPPAADLFAANAPAEVHQAVAAAIANRDVRWAVASGFGADQEQDVVAGYRRAGLTVSRRREVNRWVVLIFAPELRETRGT